MTRLADNEHYATWARTATVEERVVAYADKRAMADLVSMDDRFHVDREARRNGRDAVARDRAEILEASVCAAAGIKPDEVERLRWAEAALTPRQAEN